MAGEVQKLGIEPDLRSPSDDDALEVVIAMAMGDTTYLIEGPGSLLPKRHRRLLDRPVAAPVSYSPKTGQRG